MDPRRSQRTLQTTRLRFCVLTTPDPSGNPLSFELDILPSWPGGDPPVRLKLGCDIDGDRHITWEREPQQDNQRMACLVNLDEPFHVYPNAPPLRGSLSPFGVFAAIVIGIAIHFLGEYWQPQHLSEPQVQPTDFVNITTPPTNISTPLNMTSREPLIIGDIIYTLETVCQASRDIFLAPVHGKGPLSIVDAQNVRFEPELFFERVLVSITVVTPFRDKLFSYILQNTDKDPPLDSWKTRSLVKDNHALSQVVRRFLDMWFGLKHYTNRTVPQLVGMYQNLANNFTTYSTNEQVLDNLAAFLAPGTLVHLMSDRLESDLAIMLSDLEQIIAVVQLPHEATRLLQTTNDQGILFLEDMVKNTNGTVPDVSSLQKALGFVTIDGAPILSHIHEILIHAQRNIPTSSVGLKHSAQVAETLKGQKVESDGWFHKCSTEYCLPPRWTLVKMIDKAVYGEWKEMQKN